LALPPQESENASTLGRGEILANPLRYRLALQPPGDRLQEIKIAGLKLFFVFKTGKIFYH